MIDIKGKAAILTGAAEGWGYQIAKALVGAGMKLALMDVQAEKLRRAAEEFKAMGGECLPIVVDLASAEATQAAAEEALAYYGTPRVLIHNAAVLKEVSMLDVTFDNWRREMNIIIQAAFILSKAVWPGMVGAKSGSIVFISSGSGIKGFVKETAYTPAKHAQEGLMKVLAMEGEPFNIAVNTITPGIAINTPMSASHYTPEQQARWVDPAMIAPAFVYLAGLDAKTTTGHRLDAWQLSEAVRVGQKT
ncbi:MAG: SDR family NAD(P)-dependent oxidoreductase [Anaerolineaceae bacterium]|nr:SDR family NAD(P)-dependent oxidoreductase [Anaerolineaceae bacterium]